MTKIDNAYDYVNWLEFRNKDRGSLVDLSALFKNVHNWPKVIFMKIFIDLIEQWTTKNVSRNTIVGSPKYVSDFFVRQIRRLPTSQACELQGRTSRLRSTDIFRLT